MPDPTTDEVAKAAKQHAVASGLIKKAEKLLGEARDVLLEEFKPDAETHGAFKFAGGRTWRGKFDGVEVDVSIPMSAGKPASLGQAGTDAAADEMLSTYGSCYGIFAQRWEFDPDRCRECLADPNVDESFKQFLAALLAKYETPAEAPKPLSPRVSSKHK